MTAKRRTGRASSLLLLLRVAAALALLALAIQDASPVSAEESRRKSDEINERAGVKVPDGFGDGGIARQVGEAAGKVERGAELSEDESSRYRIAYQSAIFQMQDRLRRFDGNLTVLTNVD